MADTAVEADVTQRQFKNLLVLCLPSRSMTRRMEAIYNSEAVVGVGVEGHNYQLDYISKDIAELSFDVNIRVQSKLEDGEKHSIMKVTPRSNILQFHGIFPVFMLIVVLIIPPFVTLFTDQMTSQSLNHAVDKHKETNDTQIDIFQLDNSPDVTEVCLPVASWRPS